MNRKVIVTSLIFSIISLSSMAQVDKQVEVTKIYIPQIETPTKLKLEPDMVDTVRLEPEIDYSVTPKSIETTLSPRLYKPATVTYWEFNRPKRTYVKAGLGYPLSSIADIYISDSNPNTNYFIGYLNHKGEYGELTNDYGDKLSALNSQNSMGVAAGKKIGSRTLEGEFSYDVDTWSRYATENSITPRPLYQTINLSGRYGDDFVDFSKWNYNFDLDVNYFYGRNSYNMIFGAGANMGKDMNNGRVLFGVGYDHISGDNNYLNSSILLDIAYIFKTGSWKWEIGGEYCFDMTSFDDSQNNSVGYALPRFALHGYDKAAIQPFMEFKSDLIRYNYYSLVEQNPYVLEGFANDKNGVEYSLMGGIEGNIKGEKFSYRLFGGYSVVNDAIFWTLNEEEVTPSQIENYYSAEFGRLYSLTIGGELEYSPIADLNFDLGVSLYNYSTAGTNGASAGRPYSMAYVGGEYKFNNVKFGASADMNGVSYTTRYYTDASLQTEKSEAQIKMGVDLKAFVEVELKKDLVLFMEGSNLTNATLYNWMGYRKYGVGVMAGAKLQF